MNEFLSVIVSFLMSGITCFTVHKGIERVVNNKKFNKDYYHGSKVKIVFSENIKSKGKRIDQELLKNKELYDKVMLFVNRLVANFSEEELINFYSQINNLKVSRRISSFEELCDAFNSDGVYYNTENKIVIYHGQNQGTIFHELFHMASSRIYKNNDFCGFSCDDDKNLFGTGLNEGYTECMVERYFPEFYDGESTYDYEKLVTQKLEIIVGRELMQKAYMQANLSAVVLELQKYVNRGEILKFIKKLDLLEKYARIKNMSRDNRTILEKLMIDVNMFLIRAYTNKLGKENKVVTDDLVTSVFMYAKELIEYRGSVSSLMCYEDVFEILDNVWKTDGLNRGIVILNNSGGFNK